MASGFSVRVDLAVPCRPIRMVLGGGVRRRRGHLVNRRAFNERRLNGLSSAQSRGSSKIPEASHDGSRHSTVRLWCTSGRSQQAPRAACEASGGSLAPSDGLHALTGDEGQGGTKQAAPHRPRQRSGGRARRGASPLHTSDTTGASGRVLRTPADTSGSVQGFRGKPRLRRLQRGHPVLRREGWLLRSTRSEELKFDPCWVRVLDSENRRVSSCSSPSSGERVRVSFELRVEGRSGTSFPSLSLTAL